MSLSSSLKKTDPKKDSAAPIADGCIWNNADDWTHAYSYHWHQSSSAQRKRKKPYLIISDHIRLEEALGNAQVSVEKATPVEKDASEKPNHANEIPPFIHKNFPPEQIYEGTERKPSVYMVNSRKDGAPMTKEDMTKIQTDVDKVNEEGKTKDLARVSKAKQKLPPSLQVLVDQADRDDSFYTNLWDGTTQQSTDTNLRYAAYTQRIRQAFVAGQRYVAYTSDIGESFRPIARPWLVTAAYGVSWTYLIGDVVHEGYKAYCRNQHVRNPQLPRVANEHRYTDGKGEYPNPVLDSSGDKVKPGVVPLIDDFRMVAAQRAIFQGIASMGLPAFTVHGIVKYSGRYLKNAKSPRIRICGPIGLGLAAVPALPFLFDAPVEKGVEWAFHRGLELYGGKEAVADSPETGREAKLLKDNKRAKGEKEL